jgi:hypothetical protein
VTIRFSAEEVTSKDKIDFEVTVRNVSAENLYICGDINIQDASTLCSYTLQVRRKGTDKFQEPLVKAATDSIGSPYGDGSVAQFKDRMNIFYLHPQQTLGKQISDLWGRRISTSSGKYEVRLLYRSVVPLPVRLDKPFLQGTITSNVVEIEVLP